MEEPGSGLLDVLALIVRPKPYEPLTTLIRETKMSLESAQHRVFSALQIALACALLCLPVGASAQQQGVFSRFAGDWSGEGTVKISAGRERIRCKAHYTVTPDGTSLEQTLRCASDSYKLEVTSTGIRGKIDGIGFTADLVISTQANRQSVIIDPTGATDISHVSITMTR